MENYTIIVNDIELNTTIERDMTEEERLNYISILNDMAARKAEAEAKAAEKAVILARLGLTEDELKTILGVN
jgi:ABC-type Na+ transport system ATPase subunit NatA